MQSIGNMVDMPDFHCRLAKVEERIDHQDQMINDLMNEYRRQACHTHELLEEIQTDLSKIKGFTTGVAFVFSLFGAVISFFWDKFTGH